MLEQLVIGGEKEPAIIARLVKACAESDVSKAEKYANMLPELDSGDVDVQELESFQTVAAPRERDEVPEGAGGAEGAGAGGGDGAAGAEMQQKKKAKAGKANRKKEKAIVVTEDGRKVVCEAYKLPAKYEMLVEIGSWGKPDPERWLPWYQVRLFIPSPSPVCGTKFPAGLSPTLYSVSVFNVCWRVPIHVQTHTHTHTQSRQGSVCPNIIASLH